MAAHQAVLGILQARTLEWVVLIIKKFRYSNFLYLDILYWIWYLLTPCTFLLSQVNILWTSLFSSFINFKQRIYHGVDITHWDFQRYSGKESTCQFRRCKLIPGLGKSPGGGNGNPIQYSCLENPLARGAWWATVHRVSESWTWLSNWTYIYIYHLQYSLHFFVFMQFMF